MKIKVIVGVLAALFAGYLFASPWITVHQLQSAVEARDADTITKLVDFPVLRQNLKDQFNAAMAARALDEKEGEYAVLATSFAGSLVEKFVDALITPEGIRQIMVNNASEMKQFEVVSSGYESFNRFAVIRKLKDGEEGRYLFERRGLGWKLVGIDVDFTGIHD